MGWGEVTLFPVHRAGFRGRRDGPYSTVEGLFSSPLLVGMGRKDGGLRVLQQLLFGRFQAGLAAAAGRCCRQGSSHERERAICSQEADEGVGRLCYI